MDDIFSVNDLLTEQKLKKEIDWINFKVNATVILVIFSVILWGIR